MSAQDLAALGETLGGLAATLEGLAGVRGADAWALGPGRSGAALQDVLGNWTHQRLQLARALRALAEGAHGAGAAYLRVEADVSAVVGGGPMP